MTDQSTVAATFAPGANWVRATRFANVLLRRGHRVLVVTDPLDGSLRRGALVVPLSPAHDPELAAPGDGDALRSAAAESGVELAWLSGRDRFVAAPLAVARVGLYGGGGAPFNHAGILAECGFPVRFVSDAEIRAGVLDRVDALIVPGGGFRAMHGQIEPLGEEGCQAIAAFVRRGGLYVGCCAGSYDCAVAPDDFVRSCPAQRWLQLVNARVWNDASVDFGALQSPGVGVLTVRNERPDHPVMYGLPASFEIVHYNGPIFDPLPDLAVEGASLAVGLTAFAGWTERFTPSEAFVGATPDPETILLQRAIAAGRYSAVAGEFGLGRVVAFGSHPEFGFDLAMARWGDAARMLANAVLWQASSLDGRRWAPAPPRRERLAFPAGAACDAVAAAAEAVRGRLAAVRTKPIEPAPAWLTPDYALSLFGLPPDEIWRRSIDETAALAGEIGERAAALRDQIGAVLAAARSEPDLTDAVLRVNAWLLDERPAEWRQDGGYHGALALLRTASRMCDEALARWDDDLGPPAGAYAYLHENPYHLVAGSYLAAVGCVAGALHLLRVAAAELEMALRVSGANAPIAQEIVPAAARPAETVALR